ncbi:hypothetical protein EJ04DRAFT_138622 [Polyplosphaeria fusca]|uniref:Uncharacterized protein n=1 Tax=Polyplosphaeria fusca TaxID=682080 RepID=A0A9P4V605_9PLEO|nr:hypothetical protein EJ04DRAFT_138622 [Polyplosphaeria fusca]
MVYEFLPAKIHHHHVSLKPECGLTILTKHAPFELASTCKLVHDEVMPYLRQLEGELLVTCAAIIASKDGPITILRPVLLALHNIGLSVPRSDETFHPTFHRRTRKADNIEIALNCVLSDEYSAQSLRRAATGIRMNIGDWVDVRFRPVQETFSPDSAEWKSLGQDIKLGSVISDREWRNNWLWEPAEDSAPTTELSATFDGVSPSHDPQLPSTDSAMRARHFLLDP